MVRIAGTRLPRLLPACRMPYLLLPWVFHSRNGAASDYFVFNDYRLLRTEPQGHMAVIGGGKHRCRQNQS